MWDYDKLFAEDNIVGLTIENGEDVYNQVVSNPDYWEDGQEMNWNLYKNEELSSCEETGFKFEIQYIIRLDKHGNIVEKLFDRNTDMPKPMPNLETGMFVRVNTYGGSHIGFVDAENNHVIYQDGDYDFIKDDDINGRGIVSKIVEVYGKDTCAFNFCTEDDLIWRKLESN